MKAKHIKRGIKKFGGWEEKKVFVATGNEKFRGEVVYYEYKNIKTGKSCFLSMEY